MTKLTPEQSDWYERHFGQRYSAVQENHLRPSRRVRRGRGTTADYELLKVQQAEERKLREAQIRPA